MFRVPVVIVEKPCTIFVSETIRAGTFRYLADSSELRGVRKITKPLCLLGRKFAGHVARSKVQPWIPFRGPRTGPWWALSFVQTKQMSRLSTCARVFQSTRCFSSFQPQHLVAEQVLTKSNQTKLLFLSFEDYNGSELSSVNNNCQSYSGVFLLAWHMQYIHLNKQQASKWLVWQFIRSSPPPSLHRYPYASLFKVSNRCHV